MKLDSGVHILPKENNVSDLGTTNDRFKNAYFSGDVDVGGALTSASTEIISTTSLTLTSTNGTTIDATTLSIDGTDDSNLTVTGEGKDLDIAVSGGGVQELRLASAGTGANAMHLNTSAGGINIDSADMIDIDAADEITIDTTSADGHIALTSASYQQVNPF